MGDNKGEMWSVELHREAVIGFAVVQGDIPNDQYKRKYVRWIPLGFDWEGTLGEGPLDLAPGEQVVGIIPAPVGTFNVFGVPLEDGEMVDLGYEVPGAYHPNWHELTQEKLRRQKSDK